MKWFDKLEKEERSVILHIAGKLSLPSLSEYQSLVHFLNDVYGRLVGAHSLIKQADKVLGE